MSQLKFEKISWKQMEQDCLELYKSKMTDLKVDRIISISRGGTVVSRIFSDLLNNTTISHITISSYKGMQKQSVPLVTEIPKTDFKNETILIIDEVSDTGATFEIAEKHLKEHHPKKIYTLSPYIKPHTKYKPDFWQKNIDAWIIFPYDVRETTEAFIKMFGSKTRALEKLLEVGFEKWEIDSVL
jgi:hypothetical protein